MKSVYCIRKGKALVVPQPQFMDYFTDNFSAELITKEQYQEHKTKELKDANSNLHPVFQNIFIFNNMNKVIYGSENSGLELEYITDANGDFVGINSVTLLCFNKKQPINDIVDSMRIELDAYVLKHIDTQKKYRRLENDFKERLGETISIDNENSYEIALFQWMKNTEDDNMMADLNN